MDIVPTWRPPGEQHFSCDPAPWIRATVRGILFDLGSGGRGRCARAGSARSRLSEFCGSMRQGLIARCCPHHAGGLRQSRIPLIPGPTLGPGHLQPSDDPRFDHVRERPLEPRDHGKRQLPGNYRIDHDGRRGYPERGPISGPGRAPVVQEPAPASGCSAWDRVRDPAAGRK
jgi:hypothetical protein